MRWRFNPPPGWPAQPADWVPSPDWVPDPAWPAAPAGWLFWVPADPPPPAPSAPPAPPVAVPSTRPSPAVRSTTPPAAKRRATPARPVHPQAPTPRRRLVELTAYAIVGVLCAAVIGGCAALLARVA